MPTPPPSITLDPAPHPALSYAGMRAEALELLGRLCGDQWSDFNSHDPGITILEQLCFALTELAYRSQWSIEELLATAGADWQPAAAEILSGDPVTLDDLRALLRALGGQAVLVGEPDKPELSLYFRPSSSPGQGSPPVAGDLELDADLLGRPLSGSPQSVVPRGVWDVEVQVGSAASGSGSLQAIGRRLHGARLLGRDFHISRPRLEPFQVVVNAELELHAAEVPPGLLVRLRACLDAAISEVGATGAIGGLRSVVLIQALQSLPEVRRVITLELASDPDGPFHSWHLRQLGRGARLDGASRISLFHQGLPLQPPPLAAPASLPASPDPAPPLATLDAAADAPDRPGRRRAFSSPSSLARQLPAVYGVGPAGLPADAGPERRVQALQLRAYLHIFDQLLANGQAQLAFAAQLLAPVPSQDPHPLDVEAVDLANDRDLPLTDLSDLLHGEPSNWPQTLRQALSASAPAAAAGQRASLLAYLLRRFGEELDLDARPASRNKASSVSLVEARSEFLRRIVPLTAGRGSGPDLLTAEPLAATTTEPSAPPASTEASQGAFAERLRRKLGLSFDPDGTPPLLVIEHLLLRPLLEDSSQKVQGGEDPIPFLSDVARPDPWSGRVSVVVHAARLPGTANDERETWLLRLIRQELPAHLQAELHLLADATPGQGPWSDMLAAWRRFRTLLQSHRLAALSSSAAEASDSTLLLLRLRDSRDHLISLLRIGRPWPLRSITLPEQLMVASRQSGSITLPYSQRGIRYQLVEVATGKTCGNPAMGTDGPLTLTTSPIKNDITLRVQASVLAANGTGSAAAPADANGVALTANGRARSTLLLGQILVVEGIDPTLHLRLLDASSRSRLPRLGSSGTDDDDGLARLASYGQRLEVEIEASQEGVKYQVIDLISKEPLSDWGIGTSGSLHLPLKAAAAEDRDLAVHALLNKRGNRANQPLNGLLLLRVKANPDVPLRLREEAVAAGAPARVVIGVAPSHDAKAQKPVALPSQSGVDYELRVRPLVDADWPLADPLRPADQPIPPGCLTSISGDLSDFSPRASGLGQGSELTLETPISGEGMVVAVLAHKTHRLDSLSNANANPPTQTSAVPLQQAAVVYTKPDATRQLILRVDPIQPDLWSLWGGQPGVAYTLQPEAERVKADPRGPLLAIPEGNHAPGGLRGVNRARVGRDLVVNGVAGTPPAEFKVAPSEANTLWLWAHFLRSGVEVKLERQPILVWVDPPAVAAGESAQVVVSRLKPDQTARLLIDQQLLREGVADGAGNLRLASAPPPGPCQLQLEVGGVQCPLSITQSMDVTGSVRVLDHQPLQAGAPAHLVDWDGSVVVEVANSEVNVTYTLVNAADRDKPLQQQTRLCDPEPGNGGPLHLRCQNLREDVDLLVRATRLYDAEGTRQSTGFFPTILPLRVRANPAVPLKLLNAIVDPGASVSVAIGAIPSGTSSPAASPSQAGVRYELRVRELRVYPADNPLRSDWDLADPLRPADLPPLPGSLTRLTGDLQDFQAPSGGAAASGLGNGQSITLEHPVNGEAMVVAALAHKEHRLYPFSDPNPATQSTALPLQQAAVAYTKPDATRQLTLEYDPANPGVWTLLGGQPGVAYTLKDAKGNILKDAKGNTLKELPIPEVAEAQAKRQGIGYQRVGRDLIVGLSDMPARAVAAFPLNPDAIQTLKLEARYLRSGVRVELSNPPILKTSEAQALSQGAEPTVVGPQLVGARRSRRLPIIPPPEAFSQVLTSRTGEGHFELLLLGADGSVWQSSQTDPGDGWSAPMGLGGSGYTQLVAGWSRDGRQQLFAVGPDQAAWHNVQIDAQAGGWAGWTSLGGSIKQLAVASNGDGRLELFGLGVKNGPLWVLPQTPPDDVWSTWTSLAGGITEIKAGRNSDGRLEVFAVGTDKAIYHIWQQEPGARWTGWASLAGNCRCLDLETNEDGRMQVFVIGYDKALYHRLQTRTGDSTGWDPWTKLGGSTQRIASAKHLDGRLTVFAVGADQQLSCISQTAPGKGWGAWVKLGGSVVQASAQPSADGRMQVLAIGTDGGVWQIGQKEANGGWSDWTKIL